MNSKTNLTTTPFSDLEKRKKYELITFAENGMSINILNEVAKYHKIPSGNFYKFGVVVNGEYFWYFNGTPVANERAKMREIFTALTMVLKDTSNVPFIYKVKRI